MNYVIKNLLLKIDKNQSIFSFTKPYLSKINQKAWNKCIRNNLIKRIDSENKYTLTNLGIKVVKSTLELNKNLKYRTADYTIGGTDLYKTPRNKGDVKWVTFNSIISVLFAFTSFILLLVFIHYGVTFWRILLVIILFLCPDIIFHCELHVWNPTYFKIMKKLK